MCWLAVAYLVNFLDDGCQSLEEEWEVKEPLVHALHGSEEKLLTALYHLTEHELKILRLHIYLAWLYIYRTHESTKVLHRVDVL